MRKKTAGVLSAATAGMLLLTGVVTATSHNAGHVSVHANQAAYTTTSAAVSLDNCPTLLVGAHGDCVSQLQTDLNYFDNAGLSVGGTFGSATYQAVITFQQDKGMTQVDGRVGPETKQAIDDALDAGTPPSTPTSTASPGPDSSPPYSDVVNCGYFTCTTYYSRGLTKAMDASAQASINETQAGTDAAMAGLCAVAATPTGNPYAVTAAAAACATLTAAGLGSYYDQLHNAAQAGQCFAVREAGDPESPQYGLYGPHYLVRSNGYCHD
jgi:peptidoglycan hydrolase-like protein with peptidoglycan-binding domain